MPVWFKKRFQFGDYAGEQDKFEVLWQSLGCPRSMMMVASGHLADQTVYISLPEAKQIFLFPGWEQITECSLPKSASALVCLQDEFEKRFSFPSQLG